MVNKKSLFYLIWAILFSISPLLVTLFNLIKIKINISFFIVVCFFVFIILYLCRFLIHLKNGYTNTASQLKSFFTSSMKKPIPILILLCFVFFIVSSLVNGLNVYTFVFCSYFVILLCFFKLDKSQQNLIIHILIITTTLCCIMGFISINNRYVPGFEYNILPLTLQFYNPNHSAYIMATMLILSVGLMQKSKILLFEVLYSASSLIYILFLFMNGSFSAITFAFVCLGLMFLFYVIKNKRFPIKICLSIILMIATCLLIEFIPNLNNYRTNPYNYLIEVIDAINHYFHTNLPTPKMWGASREYLKNNNTLNVFTFTERQELISSANSSLSANFKSILFGIGAGSYYDLAPHNMLMSLALEFGIFIPICILAIIILSFIKFFKNKSNHEMYFIFSSLLCFFLCGMTGSLVPYSGIYMFMLLGLCLRFLINDKN